MKKIAMLYESVDGHTATVVERMGAIFKGAGIEVVPVRCKANSIPALKEADGIVIGGSIHAGRHNNKLIRFVTAHRDLIGAKPNAFFLVCLTAKFDSPEKAAEVVGYLKDFETRTGLIPGHSQAFAGALLYTKYNFIMRALMKSITKKEGGDVDTSRDYIYTDWQAVETFARSFLDRCAA